MSTILCPMEFLSRGVTVSRFRNLSQPVTDFKVCSPGQREGTDLSHVALIPFYKSSAFRLRLRTIGSNCGDSVATICLQKFQKRGILQPVFHIMIILFLRAGWMVLILHKRILYSKKDACWPLDLTNGVLRDRKVCFLKETLQQHKK